MVETASNRYRICGYCKRFSHTLIKCFSQLANIMTRQTASPLLTMEGQIYQYLRTIDDKISPITISAHLLTLKLFLKVTFFYE